MVEVCLQLVGAEAVLERVGVDGVALPRWLSYPLHRYAVASAPAEPGNTRGRLTWAGHIRMTPEKSIFFCFLNLN